MGVKGGVPPAGQEETGISVEGSHAWPFKHWLYLFLSDE